MTTTKLCGRTLKEEGTELRFGVPLERFGDEWRRKRDEHKKSGPRSRFILISSLQIEPNERLEKSILKLNETHRVDNVHTSNVCIKIDLRYDYTKCRAVYTELSNFDTTFVLSSEMELRMGPFFPFLCPTGTRI